MVFGHYFPISPVGAILRSKGTPLSIDKREQQAVARWMPPANTLFNRALTFLVVQTSRLILRRLNSITIDGADTFQSALDRGDRGLLTFCNHVSIFDDPLLLCNLPLPRYPQIRWVAADAINFFGSRWKAFIFRAGKAVPIVRGAGMGQTGFDFLRDRLNEGGWVQIFPEGGRTRDPDALLSRDFKAGIGRLMAETQPLALPFYHHGMRQVLPIGAKLPRSRQRVRLRFGQPLDCADLVREAGGAASGPQLWEALTERAHDELRRLELSINPAAREPLEVHS